MSRVRNTITNNTLRTRNANYKDCKGVSIVQLSLIEKMAHAGTYVCCTGINDTVLIGGCINGRQASPFSISTLNALVSRGLMMTSNRSKYRLSGEGMEIWQLFR